MTDQTPTPGPSPRVRLPRFASPPADPPPATVIPHPSPQDSTPDSPAPESLPPLGSDPSGKSAAKPDTDGPRTQGSTTGRPRQPADPRLTGRLAGLVLGLVALGAGWLIAKGRPGRELRQPTVDELDDVANPLGAIAARHLPAIIATADLEDAIAAGVGVRDYLIAGPLIRPRRVDPGIPTDLGDPL